MADAVAKLAAKTKSTPFYLSLCAWGWVSHAVNNYKMCMTEHLIELGSSLALGQSTRSKLESKSLNYKSLA